MASENLWKDIVRHLGRYVSLPPRYLRILVYYLAIGIVAWPLALLCWYLSTRMPVEFVYYIAAGFCFLLMVIEARIDYAQGKRIPYNILGSLLVTVYIAAMFYTLWNLDLIGG